MAAAAWRSALSRNLQELRIHLCATSPGSQGVRDFLKASVADLKRRNPGFLLLVREGEGIQAAAHARYDGGKELKEKLDGLDAGGVEGVLAKLVERGETMPRTTESAGSLPGEK